MKVQTGRLFFLILMSSTLVMGGCGKGGGGLKLVKNVQLKTYELDGDAWAEMIATLDTGNIQLPGVNFPIYNPKNPGEQIGSIAIRPALSGSGNDLALAVNITEASKSAAVSDGNLPNGLAIPVGGLGGATLIGLPIGNGGSRAYIALGPQTAVLGAAIVIKEFDKLGKSVGGLLNIFPKFKVGAGISGVAGIFTSAAPSQSGIAVFVDASSALLPMMQKMASTQALSLRVSGVDITPAPTEKATFNDVMPSQKKQIRLFNELYKMHSARTRVHVR